MGRTSIDGAANRLSSSQDLFDCSWRRKKDEYNDTLRPFLFRRVWGFEVWQINLKKGQKPGEFLSYVNEMFQTFRHRVVHWFGQLCFLKLGWSEPPLDYTQSLWQTGIVAGGWAVKENTSSDVSSLTREFPGDGARPHDASNSNNLIEGDAATVLDWKIKSEIQSTLQPNSS